MLSKEDYTNGYYRERSSATGAILPGEEREQWVGPRDARNDMSSAQLSALEEEIEAQSDSLFSPLR